MRVEEQVRVRLEADRAVARRSFAWATEEQSARREALHRSVERWKFAEQDLADVADAMRAYEATIERLRALQAHLRELGSPAEFERRVSRAKSRCTAHARPHAHAGPHARR